MVIFAVNLYRAAYTQRNPLFSRNDDETRLLTVEDGVFEFFKPLRVQVVFGMPPTSRDEAQRRDNSKYLWVIVTSTVPTVLEFSERFDGFTSGRATHTNLTGGGESYCGGEAWFQSCDNIYISGASGRYPARNLQELNDICLAFERLGYNVTCFGWDDERNAPSRYYRA